MIAVDTNVLIYADRTETDLHDTAAAELAGRAWPSSLFLKGSKP